MASRHGNSPKILSANHTAAGAIGLRAVATSQRDDAERYMRGYEAYEQFLAMSNQEAGGSGSGIKRTRAYIPREREEAEQRLLDDYFGDDETPPKYPEENFRRRYRMSSTLFAQIVNDITSYDAQPLPEYFCFFRKGYDATGRASIGPILKCTSAIRQLAYGTTPDAFDEYLQIAERCSRECLDNFTKCIYILYVEEYLRRPSLDDIEKTYALHEENMDPGIYVVSRANNDLNVLYGSPLFDDVLADTAPEAPFTILLQGNEKTMRFKRGFQESARKDIERAFGVLQGRWGIIRQPARALQINTLKRIICFEPLTVQRRKNTCLEAATKSYGRSEWGSSDTTDVGKVPSCEETMRIASSPIPSEKDKASSSMPTDSEVI
ncbi:RNA-directed DNA polymerase, eukaryota [Tanacetum coccineum]